VGPRKDVGDGGKRELDTIDRQVKKRREFIGSDTGKVVGNSIKRDPD